MNLARRAVIVASWLCISLGGSAAQGPDGVVEQHGMRVTTDTREYCNLLMARIAAAEDAALAPLPRAQMLATEGRRMCARGQVRPGIARLRRALMLLEARR